MKRRTIQAVVVALVLGSCSAASASVITFTNRASWTSAVGAIEFTVDFETFVTNTSFATSPLNVGPFTLSTTGVAALGTDFVDVSPGAFPASLGNVAAEFFVQGPLTADLVFTNPVRGFFADFLYAGNTEQLDLTLSLVGGGTADVLVPGIGTDLEPFGFISTNAITAIRLNNSVNDGFFVDNISGATVPEARSMTLLLLGLASLVACHRGARRNARS